MALFPTPTVNDTQDLLTIFRFVNNDATGGLFFPIIILVIWFVSFIGSIAEGRPASRAFLFSSFISTVLAIPIAIIGMLAVTYVYFLILLVAFGAVWVKLESARNF